jgi:hypothetical protein
VALLDVRFQDNIDSIQIDFGHSININTPNPYLPSYQNCQLLFSNPTLMILGTGPRCYLDMAYQKQIYINLGAQTTVVVGDTLELNQDMVMDIDDPSCTNYIEKFF